MDSGTGYILRGVILSDNELSELHGELGSFLVGLCQHVDDACESRDSDDQADHIGIAGEQAAELVDHEGADVSEATLIADGEPSPL